MPQPPFISVIMPIRNEADFIARSLGAVLDQNYPKELFEILVVDGMSTDETRAIVTRLGASVKCPLVRLLDNEKKIVPPAMNIGIKMAKGDFIVRVDGHCIIQPDYLKKCVEISQATHADNVGGIMLSVGQNQLAEAVALATSCPFGVGGAKFHYTKKADWVDTVYLGSYKKEIFSKIGLYDEEMVRNQDDELNFRLTQAGGKIWLDPSLKTLYYTRSSFRKLWRQYFQYGLYKVVVIRKRGGVASSRHLVPATFVSALCLSMVFALVIQSWHWALIVAFPYLVANLAFSIWMAKRNPRILPLLPAVFAILHLSYGVGFIWGLWKWWSRGQKITTSPVPTARDHRFIILSQYYPPEIGAPQVRLSEMAKRMRTAGYNVTVLTAMPNYPLGHYYPGYGGWFRRETHDGIEVLRVPIYPTKRVQMMPRLSNYFSFIFTSLFWGALKLPRAGYLMVESPPLFTGLAALLLAKLKGARLIFNVSDLWPDSPVRLGVLHPGLTLSLARWLERVFYRHSWLVTVQSEETLANIHQRFPHVPLHHLSNGVDLTVFAPERRTAVARTRLTGGDSDAVVAVYTGLHGLAQGLDQLLLAAAQLRDLPHFRLVLVGDGPEKDQLLALKQRLRLDHVFFFDPVPQQEVPALTASADIAVIPLRIRLPGAVPSKLYEAMACGLPALVVAQGEPAHIVEETHSGIAVASGDITGLEAALRRLIADPVLRASLGATGRRVAGTRFNRNIIVDQFIQRLTNAPTPVAGRQPPPEHHTCAASSPTSSS